MQIIENKFRGKGLETLDRAIPFPSVQLERPARLLAVCPAFSATPLTQAAELARACRIAALYVKNERARFGLGSFKALGAAYVIACDAAARAGVDVDNLAGTDLPDSLHRAPERLLKGETYVAASAGNHGVSVAAGARVFGAQAVIYLAETVPENFAEKLRKLQAIVVRAGTDYAQSMAAAMQTAKENNWHLLSDSSWPGYFDVPWRLGEGYLQMGREIAEQIAGKGETEGAPSHVFLQAGVGGFASAMAAWARQQWGDRVKIIVVEPDAAPALFESIKQQKPVLANGPVSSMGRLDCKEPSLIGLKGLARDADFFMTCSDAEVEAQLSLLAAHDLATTPSGGAGFAGLFLARKAGLLGLDETSRPLIFLTEAQA